MKALPKLLAALFGFSLLACAGADQPLAIRNVTVVDVVSARSLPAQTVVTEGGRIVAVGNSPTIPSGARVVDGTGKYLIPGLWDMHTHFTSDPSSLTLFLANGVTGVRDMGSIAVRRKGTGVENLPRDEAIRAIIQAREDVKSGKVLGPRIYTVGMIVTGPNPRNPNAPAAPHQIVVKTPKEAREAVAKLQKMGVDAIKVHARLTRETYDAIVNEAKRRGLSVVGHVPFALDPIVVSNAGQKSIEHVTGVWEYAHKGLPDTDERMNMDVFQQEIDLFRANRTWHIPTLVNYQAAAEAYRITRRPETEPLLDYVVPELAMRWMGDWSLSDFSPEQSQGFSDSVLTLQEMIEHMNRGGVPIMAGTDSGGIFTYPGFSLHKELELLNQAGMSPMQTLQAATIRPAQFLGIESAAGSITRGKVADLVLLGANPLEDVRNTSKIEAVVVRGKLLDRAELDTMLKAVRKRAQPTRQLLKNGRWGG